VVNTDYSIVVPKWARLHKSDIWAQIYTWRLNSR